MANELVPIPPYSLEDFTETTVPYELLLQYSNNSFLQRQMIERMKKRASEVGLRSFMTLWQEYSKQNGKKGDESNTEFDGLPLKQQLKSGKYICTMDGVSTIDSLGFLREICPHPIAPIRRFKNVDSKEELLEIWFRKGIDEASFRDETIIVSKDDISNSISKLAKYGVVVTPKNAKDLAAYLLDMEQYNYSFIEEKKSVKRLGWVGRTTDFSPYVEDVYFDGEEDFGSMFSAVRASGSYEKWVEIVRKVRAERTAARYYLAASFASVLLKPCGLLPFLVHTWGGTENGKTVALMVAASVWACPEMGEYVKTFDGTVYGQSTMAGFLNNLPLCLDELQIQTSQGAKDFDAIVYRLCEGVSKLQGKASGGLRKQQTWRNVILSNGEHTIIKPLSGGGARNRVIEIEAPEKVYSDLVGLCEEINQNYGFAGKTFVDWLCQDGNMDRARALQKDYYQQLRETGATDKQTASASAMLAADHIVTEMIFRDGNALTVEDMEKALLKKDDIDINARTLEWLPDFVAANSNHFNDDNGNTEIWGKVDENISGENGETYGMVYFIRSVFDRELKAHGLDSKSFLAWADRRGLLEHGQGRKDKQMRIPGTKGNPRCVCLKIMETPETVENTILSPDSELPF